MSKSIWKRNELIAALNLYLKIPFGKIHHRNQDLINLARLIGRTPSAVAWKLSNFARLDPNLQSRGISGASHGSKADEAVWNDFISDPESLAFESEKIIADLYGKSIEEFADIPEEDLPKMGEDRERLVKTRVNQRFFRSVVLTAYDFRCCITGLEAPELLNASHVVPWRDDKKNRLNVRNGLCLNVLHDRAFDRGIFTVTPEFVVRFSPSFLASGSISEAAKYVTSFDGTKITVPERVAPDIRFLKHHNQFIFERYLYEKD